MAAQITQKFPAFYGTQNFITLFATARQQTPYKRSKTSSVSSPPNSSSSRNISTLTLFMSAHWQTFHFDRQFTLTDSSHYKINKCTNHKIIFLRTICHNSDMFWSILIICRELLNIDKVHIKNESISKYIKIKLKFSEILWTNCNMFINPSTFLHMFYRC